MHDLSGTIGGGAVAGVADSADAAPSTVSATGGFVCVCLCGLCACTPLARTVGRLLLTGRVPCFDVALTLSFPSSLRARSKATSNAACLVVDFQEQGVCCVVVVFVCVCLCLCGVQPHTPCAAAACVSSCFSPLKRCSASCAASPRSSKKSCKARVSSPVSPCTIEKFANDCPC